MKYRVHLEAVVDARSEDEVYAEVAGRLSEYLEIRAVEAVDEIPVREVPEPLEYRYAAVNRPPGYASVPDGYIRVEERPAPGEPHYDTARHGFVVYDRPLTDKETRSYELAPVLSVEEERCLAGRIISAAEEYADEYIAVAEEDFGEFRAMVASELSAYEREAQGYRPSIGDFDDFAASVLACLRGVRLLSDVLRPCKDQ